MNEIEITLTIKGMLEDIRHSGHVGYIGARNCNSDEGARKAMEKRIDYYQNLIVEGKLKLLRGVKK